MYIGPKEQCSHPIPIPNLFLWGILGSVVSIELSLNMSVQPVARMYRKTTHSKMSWDLMMLCHNKRRSNAQSCSHRIRWIFFSYLLFKFKGDTRVNVNPYVTPLYTIFLRSHNRLAKQIKAAKKSWNDQRIFKLARKLNTVIYRNIVLNEWSKIVLGERSVDQMIDEISSEQQIADWTDPLSNGISNEFGEFILRILWNVSRCDMNLNFLNIFFCCSYWQWRHIEL